MKCQCDADAMPATIGGTLRALLTSVDTTSLAEASERFRRDLEPTAHLGSSLKALADAGVQGAASMLPRAGESVKWAVHRALRAATFAYRVKAAAQVLRGE